jgi:serine phosphatase RsbU (regulator of sigma subunit)
MIDEEETQLESRRAEAAVPPQPLAGGSEPSKGSELSEAPLAAPARERPPVLRKRGHERQASWLRLAQTLPELIDRTLPLQQTYIRLGRELVGGLELQRVAFFEIVSASGTRALRPIGGPGIVRPLGEGAPLLAERRASICNDPIDDPAVGALAEAVGLHRFIWSRVNPHELPAVLLVAGFERNKAGSEAPFEEGDEAYIVNVAQHLETLIGHAFLVNELERDKANLEELSETLEGKVAERTRELALANTEIAQALEELRQKDNRLNEDLEQARTFQQSILPTPPASTLIAFETIYRPVDLVGGDIYDICEIAPGLYRMFVADATGHGVQASLRTIVLKSEYDQLKETEETPDLLLHKFNRRLLATFRPGEMLSTGCCFDVDLRAPSRPVLRYANGAHPPLLRATRGRVDEIYCDGPLLGIPAKVIPRLIEISLEPGDLLVACSDGACEQLGPKSALFDFRGAVREAARVTASMAAFADNLWRRFELHRDETPIADDVTILAARISPVRAA